MSKVRSSHQAGIGAEGGRQRRGYAAEMPEPLQDKVALVTGASSGLGAETAQLLSRQGATVFGLGRDTGRLADVFAGVERGAYASVDIASAQACRDGVEQCVRQFGGLDVLVNVAGRHQMRRTESMTDDDWARDLAVNLNGPFYLCRAALPHLLERGGNIVNVASIAGVEGQAYSAGYCAAKHGLIGLTRALAVEYTADRLRVNAICPGGMLTPQLEQFSAPDNPNYDLIMRTAAPRGFIQPSDVANVIAFLASDAATAIHGAVYRVDNGKGAG
jgi:meso-butanediol dehydrogenase / (S,S)-butanediol dehydrogenase / diacetyl reductase